MSDKSFNQGIGNGKIVRVLKTLICGSNDVRNNYYFKIILLNLLG